MNEREMSLSERLNAIYRAFYAAYPDTDTEYWYVREVYESYLIATLVTNDGTTSYQLGYSFPDDGQVAFQPRTEWQEVKQEWVPARDLDAAKAEKRALLGAQTREIEAPPVETAETLRISEAQPEAPTGPVSNGPVPIGPVVRDFTGQIRFSSDDARTTAMIMTEDVARDGAILMADGLDTASYMRNPVVLWQHGRDPQRGALPIARCVSLERKRSMNPTESGWLAAIEWAQDEFAQGIKRQVKDGFLSSTSISWLPVQTSRKEVGGRSRLVYDSSEMLEFSFVAVPSDRNAVVTERSENDLSARLSQIESQLTIISERLATATPAPSQTATDATGTEAAPEVPAREESAAPTATEAATAPAAPRELTPSEVATIVAATVAEVRRATSIEIKRALGRA